MTAVAAWWYTLGCQEETRCWRQCCLQLGDWEGAFCPVACLMWALLLLLQARRWLHQVFPRLQLLLLLQLTVQIEAFASQRQAAQILHDRLSLLPASQGCHLRVQCLGRVRPARGPQAPLFETAKPGSGWGRMHWDDIPVVQSWWRKRVRRSHCRRALAVGGPATPLMLEVEAGWWLVHGLGALPARQVDL